MNGWKALKCVVCGGVLLLIAACRPSPPAPTGEPEGVELRAYTVPEGFDVEQIRDYLKVSLKNGELNLGTAVNYPDGTLVVTAPPGIQTGVRQLLDELEKRGPRPARRPPETVAIRYWILMARHASGPGEPVRFATKPLSEAGSLRPVLDELAAAQGPLEFSLVEQLRLVSLDQGEGARTRGRQFEVEQRVLRLDGGSPVTDIKIRSFGPNGIPHSLDTRVRLEKGKYVVLGQSAYTVPRGEMPEGWSLSDDPQLFYVITGEAA